jgi:L-lactate dehydrogenase complex protein LldG
MSADSRTTILSAVRKALVPTAPRPAPFSGGIQYADPRQQFAEALQVVGGRCLRVATLAEAHAELQSTGLLDPRRRICSLVPELVSPTFDLADVADPHTLEDVWLAVLPGEFAVAENAAIWLPTDRLRHRVVPFLTQHLVLVVSSRDVVHNMHEAYQRLTGGTGRWEGGVGFGVFLSGPSKTADIEQSLVIGAHGARSLHVVLCEG